MYQAISVSDIGAKSTSVSTAARHSLPEQWRAIPVTTRCVRPARARSIASASRSFPGFPKIRLPSATSVSAASTGDSPEREATSRAFASARRTAAAETDSPGATVSSTREGSTRKGMPSVERSSARRGEAEARMSGSSAATASACGAQGLAELVHAFIRFLGRQRQRRTKADRRVAGSEGHEALLQARREDLAARVAVGQVQGDEETLAAHVGDRGRHLLGERLELDEKMLADPARVVDEPVFFDHLEVACRPHHVHEIAAPGRVDPGGDLEDGIDVVDAIVDGDPADLRLLAEDEDVRDDAGLLEGPHRAGHPHARLHLVADQEKLVFVGEAPEAAEELGPEVVVAPLALDRLDDEGGDLVSALCQGVPDLAVGLLLGGRDLC